MFRKCSSFYSAIEPKALINRPCFLLRTAKIEWLLFVSSLSEKNALLSKFRNYFRHVWNQLCGRNFARCWKFIDFYGASLGKNYANFMIIGKASEVISNLEKNLVSRFWTFSGRRWSSHFSRPGREKIWGRLKLLFGILVNARNSFY